MSINPSNLYCLLNTKSGTTNRAKFALWSLYSWCATKESLDGNVSIIDQKSSPWSSEFDLSDNDWFVVRFLNPTVLGAKPFDILFQATDAWSLDRNPTGERGLFIQMGYHTSGVAWNIVSHQFVTNTYLFPAIATQMAQVGSFLGETAIPSLINIVGDDNWLVFLTDTLYEKKNYDSSFMCGHYGQAYKLAEPPLMLATGNMSRSLPGSPKNTDLACGWYMTATTFSSNSEVDVSGNGNNGTPAGNLVLSGVLAPNTTIWGLSHDWPGGGASSSSVILVPDTPGSWQVGGGNTPFTISTWCQLTGSGTRTILSCSGAEVANNGVFYAYADDTNFYWMFGGAAATLSVTKSALENKMHHVVFSCGVIGEDICLYIDGQLVDSTTRTSIFGSYSYHAGRYLTIGAEAKSSDPQLVAYSWSGPIADVTFYTSAKSQVWVNMQYTRSVIFSPGFFSPSDHSGILSWDHAYSSGYDVFQFESIDSSAIMNSSNQPNIAYTPNKYNDSQLLLKTVIDASRKGGLAGGVIPIRSTYGKNNKLRDYGSEHRFVAGDDSQFECALSIISDGSSPGSL